MKLSGKSLLPYNVTPPRPAGPTEAERKIEELTRQLEEEMERNEEQGEYFGGFWWEFLGISINFNRNSVFQGSVGRAERR